MLVGPQIRKMLASKELEESIFYLEKNAWQAFRMTVKGFLGNHRKEEYVKAVSHLIESYQNLGCRKSLKLHYLHFHLDFFHENLGDVSKEHGEHFHQHIRAMEKQYQGRWDEIIMGNCIWSLV